MLCRGDGTFLLDAPDGLCISACPGLAFPFPCFPPEGLSFAYPLGLPIEPDGAVLERHWVVLLVIMAHFFLVLTWT